MKTLDAIGVCALLLAASQSAMAGDKAACLNASSQGQTLRDAHKLIEARDQFRTCARASCPGVVQKDCTMWLDDAEKALPTVVLSARDANGKDLGDVRVSEGGRVLVKSLDGMAIPMNPGPHMLRFELPDGRSVEQQVVVREGLKAFAVTTTLPKAPDAAPIAGAPPVAPAPAASTATETVSSSRPEGRPSRTGAYVAGSVGVAGVVAGSITGLMAMSKKNTAAQNCAGSECNSTGADAGNSGKSLATMSTVAFGVGIAGLAVGTILWFTAKPSSAETATTGVRAWQAGIDPLPGGGFMLSTGRAW